MITSITVLIKAVLSTARKEELIALILCILIPAISLVLYIAFAKNRTKNNILRYFLVTAAVLIVSDILLYPYFIDNGSFINRGMLGVGLAALPYVFMIFNTVIQMAVNLKKQKD